MRDYIEKELEKINTGISNYKKSLVCIMSEDVFHVEDLELLTKIISQLCCKRDVYYTMLADFESEEML